MMSDLPTALLGSWVGTDGMLASAWAPASDEPASLVIAKNDLGLVEIRHTQAKPEGYRGLTLVDLGAEARAWHFDAHGFRSTGVEKVEAEETQVTILRQSSRGDNRTTYRLAAPSELEVTVEFRAAPGSAWSNVMRGRYRPRPQH